MDDSNRLDRIETKIDGLGQHLSDISVTLAGQHESLNYHIKRTDLLEKEQRGMKTRQDMGMGALKLLGAVATILTILEAIRALK